MSQVIVIAPDEDLHARAVRREVHELGFDCHIIDLARMGIDWVMSFDAAERLQWDTLAGVTLQPTALWWRRPGDPEAGSIAQEDVRTFAQRSSMTLAVGALQAAVTRHVNPLECEFLINRKPRQLWLADQVGLATPETLITNDPVRAREFLSAGRNVYKTVTSWHFDMKETRLVTPDVLDDLESIRECPVIFQRFLAGATEARVTVVGDEVFVAVEDIDQDYQTDGRYYHDTLRAGALPESVIDRLRIFHRRTGLVFGTYDFRLDADGEWVFLEVNSSGQFLFVEIQTGHPISAAIARQLTGIGSGSEIPVPQQAAVP